MSKHKTVPFRILPWVLAFVLALAAVCIGITTQNMLAHARIGFWISVGLLAALLGGNILATLCFKKWLNGRKVRDQMAYFERQLTEIRAHAEKQRRKMEWFCVLTGCYLVLLGVAALSAAFFAGAAGFPGNGCSVLVTFLLQQLLDPLFHKKTPVDHSLALPEDAYPHLYAFVRETAGYSQDKLLYIFPGSTNEDQECNASVLAQDEETHLLLGPMLLNVVTAGELRQILRHEFAHMDAEDPQELGRFSGLMRYLSAHRGSGEKTAVLSWISSFPALWLFFWGQYYFQLSSYQKETRADAAAADSGDLSSQACALAKISAYHLFAYEQLPYTNFYTTEAIPQQLETQRIRLFRQQLTEKAAFWREILENEIPAKSATHPTFRQRWEALGFCAYSLEPSCEDTPLSREFWAVAEEVDRRMADIPMEEYENSRKEFYLEPLKIVTEYESHNTLLPPEQMRPVISAYFTLGKPEQTERLCDLVIEGNDSPFATAYAHFWKGIVQLHRFDREGLTHLYQAMETNRNYVEEGLELIGHFCTMMGLEAELNEYRNRAADFLQEKADCSAGGIHSKAELAAESLPEDWQEKILAFILEHANGCISHVYLVQERVNPQYHPSSFVLRFREGTEEDTMIELYDEVFRLLDDWPVDWEFALYHYEPQMEKPLNKVPGSCIYQMPGNT